MATDHFAGHGAPVPVFRVWGLVVDFPRGWSFAFVGFRYRSSDAADIDSSCALSPWHSSASSWVRIDAARYFPHCPPVAAHTLARISRAS